MKVPALLVISVFIFNPGFSQLAMNFTEADQQGISISELDNTYKSGVHTDTSMAVFVDNQEEYLNSYNDLLRALGKYLSANNFNWDKITSGFNRIYFAEDGSIDYFLYNFRSNQISQEKEEEFGKLLTQFIKDYKFPLTAKTGFAQCSPVRYMPAAK